MKACVINRHSLFAKSSLVMVGCELEPSNPEVCINLHMEYILIVFLKLKVTIAKKRNEK